MKLKPDAVAGRSRARRSSGVREIRARDRALSADIVDAFADHLLARGAPPLSITAVRDAADVLRGRIACDGIDAPGRRRRTRRGPGTG